MNAPKPKSYISLNSDSQIAEGVIAFDKALLKVKTLEKELSGFLRSQLPAINQFLNHHGNASIPGRSDIICLDDSEGTIAEVMLPDGKGWQKGKIRIRTIIEFEPEVIEIPLAQETKNSLDELRKSGNED